MKLLLDEMYPGSIAGQLRGRGHDAVSVHDRGEDSLSLEGATDPEILTAAQAAGRALVTEEHP